MSDETSHQATTALSAWQGALVTALKAGLEAPFDAQIEFDLKAPEATDSAGLETTLPADGVAFVGHVTVGDAGKSIFLMLEHETIELLALLALKDGTEPEADARLAAIAGALGTCLEKVLASGLVAGAAWKWVGPVRRAAGAWAGEAPSLGSSFATARTSLMVADQRMSGGYFVVAEGCLGTPTASAAIAAGSTVVLGGPELAQRLHQQFPERPLSEIGSLSDLVARWQSPDLGGAIVEVAEGEEWMLPMLQGLLAFPGCGDKPLVVVLDHPTAGYVVECARLGLHRVLPPEFSAEELLERLERT